MVTTTHLHARRLWRPRIGRIFCGELFQLPLTRTSAERLCKCKVWELKYAPLRLWLWFPRIWLFGTCCWSLISVSQCSFSPSCWIKLHTVSWANILATCQDMELEVEELQLHLEADVCGHSMEELTELATNLSVNTKVLTKQILWKVREKMETLRNQKINRDYCWVLLTWSIGNHPRPNEMMNSRTMCTWKRNQPRERIRS